MTIDQLRYVSEVAKCSSFNKASENLYISQPSLSVSISKLEKELGEPLFIRSNTGVVPTPFGHELLPFIQDIVNLYAQMPLQVYGKTAKNSNRLSVANGSFRFFSAAVASLYMAHRDEGIHIELHDVPIEQSRAMIKNGNAQIGGFSIWSFQKELVESRLRRDGIQFVPLLTATPSVTVGPNNPLWTRNEDWVTVDMIQQYPIIYSFNEHSNMLLKKLGLYNRGNLITCKERAGRGELVALTDGVSISGFPLQAYQKVKAYPDQRIFHLRGYDYTNEFGYIFNQSYALSHLALEFIDCLTKLLPN